MGFNAEYEMAVMMQKRKFVRQSSWQLYKSQGVRGETESIDR